MIVAETADGYQFVTQPAHARLAGQFADHWGNDAFERPVPSAPVRLAAHAHDTGWEAYDRRPHLDDDGEPVDFREMPAGTWTDLYDEGIDAVAGMDRYAGLLVSMHGAGLRNRRYGLSPSWPETPPAFEGFVRREETRQTRLLAELRETRDSVSAADADLLAALHEDCTVPEGYDGRLWPNYKLLQAWDTLSLAFCVTDSPPGYPRIEAVPTAAGGPDETLTVAAAGDGQFRVDPYPFDTSPLSVSVPVRTVETGFEGEAELLRAYYGTPLETRSVTLRRAES
jgi:hypothetical protein